MAKHKVVQVARGVFGAGSFLVLFPSKGSRVRVVLRNHFRVLLNRFRVLLNHLPTRNYLHILLNHLRARNHLAVLLKHNLVITLRLPQRRNLGPQHALLLPNRRVDRCLI